MASSTRPHAVTSGDAPTLEVAHAVELDGVTRMFGPVPAVVRASLHVPRGETLLVRGPNGAGKTTLLRIVATAISPTYGGGSVLGLDLSREREEIRRRSELVGHRTRLYEDLTAEENLRFACRLHGVEPTAVRQVLERVGLGRVAGERVRGFSQGMRRRVALARALLRGADLLLLDEPYAGLDEEARSIVADMVAGARRDGRTTILATHDPAGTALATRTVRMDAGRLMGDRTG